MSTHGAYAATTQLVMSAGHFLASRCEDFHSRCQVDSSQPWLGMADAAGTFYHYLLLVNPYYFWHVRQKVQTKVRNRFWPYIYSRWWNPPDRICDYRLSVQNAKNFFFYLKNQRNVCASVLNILINSKLPLGICCKGNIEVSQSGFFLFIIIILKKEKGHFFSVAKPHI